MLTSPNIVFVIMSYSFCNNVKLPISAGMDVKLLLLKYNHCNDARLPISAGMDVNLL